jgi:hypothetical protein
MGIVSAPSAIGEWFIPKWCTAALGCVPYGMGTRLLAHFHASWVPAPGMRVYYDHASQVGK